MYESPIKNKYKCIVSSNKHKILGPPNLVLPSLKIFVNPSLSHNLQLAEYSTYFRL